MEKTLEINLSAAWPPERWRGERVLVAVSGGADSVALLRAMNRLAGTAADRLAVAHFNHGIRPTQAAGDAAFVRDLAQTLGLAYLEGQAQLGAPSASLPDGIEAAAREARYRFLVETAEQLGARYVVTGHTADDQAETLLHHLIRGTGLSGIAGMQRIRVLSPAVTLVRPLLGVRRSEIESYLAELHQEYVQDETNQDLSLTRNRIRHDLLPRLSRDYSPSIVESLLRLSSLAGDAQRLIETMAESLLQESRQPGEATRVVLDCRRLAGSDRHLVREVFLALWRDQSWPRQSMGAQQWELLAEMALASPEAAPPATTLPGAISAQRTGEQLVLARSDSTKDS